MSAYRTTLAVAVVALTALASCGTDLRPAIMPAKFEVSRDPDPMRAPGADLRAPAPEGRAPRKRSRKQQLIESWAAVILGILIEAFAGGDTDGDGQRDPRVMFGIMGGFEETPSPPRRDPDTADPERQPGQPPPRECLLHDSNGHCVDDRNAED